MKPNRWLAGVAVVLLVPASAAAWSGPGHAAVAALAYRELADDPALQAELTDLLRSHPKFRTWEAEYNARKSTFPAGLDFGTFLFIRAATWPDEIRRTSDPRLKRFDHAAWHYVDYPLRPPDFPAGSSPDPGSDVLFGIRRSLETLADAGADAVERAASLSWLIHLVGDVHQPLHCATLIEGAFTPPDGDRGGNGFFFYQSYDHLHRHLRTKLHAYWDGRLFGTADGAPPPEKALLNARLLLARYPRAELAELAAAGEGAAAWSFESRDAAVSDVYRFRGKALRQERVLPSGYITNSHKVAGRRLALAAYRLAGELRHTAF